MTPTATACHIRWMIRRDLRGALAVEQGCCPRWSEDDFLDCLKQRNAIGMVCTDDPSGDNIVGYMLYELHKHKLVLTRLAVHPDYRRRGIGTTMVQRLIGKLAAHRRDYMKVEVRESNLGAQLFLRRCGLLAVGIVPLGCGDEDAYKFRYDV